jgi:NAD(P)-dependent dehydrogenase (short-subunit alcohol dehydrogenase family)
MSRVLVAGASRGLGFGLCEAFAERGDHVIAAVRTSNDRLTALGVQIVEGIELTSDEAVARLPDAVGPEGLDVLIYNAGLNNDAASGRIEDIVLADVQLEFEIIALGAVRTVLTLLPTLNDGAKIMLVGIGPVALNLPGMVPSQGNHGYRMAKAALTSFGNALGRQVRDRGIAVVISDPGPVDTDALRKSAAIGRTTYNPDEAPKPIEIARMFCDRVSELTLEDSPAWQVRPTGQPALSVL